MNVLYCINCRCDVKAHKKNDFEYTCSCCKSQTLNIPFSYLRKQPASIAIQKSIVDLISSISLNIEKYISENPNKGYFTRSTDQFIEVLNIHLWYFKTTLKRANEKVGVYENAFEYSGRISSSKLKDETLNQIETIEFLYTKVGNRFMNPEKTMKKLSFYPTINQINELRSKYMTATYGGNRLPLNVVVGFDES